MKLRKIETIGDLADAYLCLPHLREMSLEDFKALFLEQEDDGRWGWYWDEDNKELLKPFIIPASEYDLMILMKWVMGVFDPAPYTDTITCAAGLTFLNRADGFMDDDIFEMYINHD